MKRLVRREWRAEAGAECSETKSVQEAGARGSSGRNSLPLPPAQQRKEQRDLWPGTEVAELSARAPRKPLVTGSPAGSAAAGEGSCWHGFRKNLS